MIPTPRVQAPQTKREKLTELYQVGLLICLMCLVLWLCFFFFGKYGRVFKGRYLVDSEKLLATRGTIVRSEPGGGKSPSYRIEYEYTVADKSYRSDLINYGPIADYDRKFFTSYLEKYPIGKSVKVFYDAKDPSFGVLEPHSYRSNKIDFAFEVAIPVTLFIFAAYFALKIKHCT